MSLFASVARAVVGALPIGTLNQKTLTVAFMEFLNNSDSNGMKSLMLKHGFTDISPLWGDQPTVPTFKSDPAVIARWPEFQQAMVYCEADWYYLSGHHGRQYAADYTPDLTIYEHANSQYITGFFNHDYHHGLWEHASVYDPHSHESPRDVFMKTSLGADFYEMEKTDNPLFVNVHSRCKGVMLIGCNTLIYKSARVAMSKYFPNALVIGLVSKENNSTRHILRVANKYGRKLFTNPESIDPAQLVQELNPRPAHVDNMGLIKDGVFHYVTPSGPKQIAVGDNLWNLDA